LATKCPDCGDSDFGTYTVDGVAHRDFVCADIAVSGGSPDGLRQCAHCGAVGEHDNGYCDACQWWA